MFILTCIVEIIYVMQPNMNLGLIIQLYLYILLAFLFA